MSLQIICWSFWLIALCFPENARKDILPVFPDIYEHIPQPFRRQMPEEYDMECDIYKYANK
jgi:hypothetical protein